MKLLELKQPNIIVVYGGGFQPFHEGHMSSYRQAKSAFPGASFFVAASNVTTERPFEFREKQFLAQQAGVRDPFIQVGTMSYVNDNGRKVTSTPLNPLEVLKHFNPERDVLVIVRSERDPMKTTDVSYYQPWRGVEGAEPFSKHAYVFVTKKHDFTIASNPVYSGSQVRELYSNADDNTKVQILQDLYPNSTNLKRIKQIFDKRLAMSESIDEARRNPERNLRAGSGKYDLINWAEDNIRDTDNWAVSMTNEPKLGINPRPAVSEDTPKGIYFYPLRYFMKMADRNESLPWGDDMPYMQLFQYDRSGEMTRETKVDPAKLKQAILPYCSEEIIQQAIDEPEYDGTPFWFIYDCLTRLEAYDETTIIRWNKILRVLGFTSVYDPGYGWIAHGEPTQGVVLDPRIIKQHKMFVNRNPTMQNRRYDLEGLANSIGWSSYYQREKQLQRVPYNHPDEKKVMLDVAKSMLRQFLGKSGEEAKEMGYDQALKAAADKVIEILKQGVSEASLSTMRDYFAGDEDARDPYKITQQRLYFSKEKNAGQATKKKEFRSQWDYEQWLKKHKITPITNKVKEELDEEQEAANLLEYLRKIHKRWAIVSKREGRPLVYFKGEGKPSPEWVERQERRIRKHKKK